MFGDNGRYKFEVTYVHKLHNSTKNEKKKSQRFFVFWPIEAEKPSNSGCICMRKQEFLTINKTESINHHQLTLSSEKNSFTH
jgi:hypothetical protein